MRCNICGEWFLTKRKLDWHLLEKHQWDEEPSPSMEIEDSDLEDYGPETAGDK